VKLAAPVTVTSPVPYSAPPIWLRLETVLAPFSVRLPPVIVSPPDKVAVPATVSAPLLIASRSVAETVRLDMESDALRLCVIVAAAAVLIVTAEPVPGSDGLDDQFAAESQSPPPNKTQETLLPAPGIGCYPRSPGD